jgi:hypothetical protein
LAVWYNDIVIGYSFDPNKRNEAMEQTYPRYEFIYVNYGCDMDDDGNDIGGEQYLGHLLKIMNDGFDDDLIDGTNEYIETSMIFTPEDAIVYLSETTRFARKTMTAHEFSEYRMALR